MSIHAVFFAKECDSILHWMPSFGATFGIWAWNQIPLKFITRRNAMIAETIKTTFKCLVSYSLESTEIRIIYIVSILRSVWKFRFGCFVNATAEFRIIFYLNHVRQLILGVNELDVVIKHEENKNPRKLERLTERSHSCCFSKSSFNYTLEIVQLIRNPWIVRYHSKNS